MSSIASEYKEGAQMMRGRGDPAAGAKTQISQFASQPDHEKAYRKLE